MKMNRDQEFDRKIIELDIMPDNVITENEKEVAWKEILSEIEPKRNFRPFVYWLSAAVVALLIALSFMVNNMRPTDYQTSSNEVLAITLTDGSQVSVNSSSYLKLEKDFDKIDRKVNLKGEAFFNVNRDELKPFVISTSNGALTVMGTSFNVNAKNNITEVSVRSGLVKLESVSGELLLKKNQKAIINLDGAIEQVEWKRNDYSWFTGVLELKGESLLEISNILSDLFNKEIQVNQSIQNCTISAKIEYETIEDVLDIVVETLEVTWSMDGETIIIEGDAC